MRPLGGAVERALRALGLESGIAKIGALEAWPDVAGAVIGSDAARTRAVRVEGDTLVVAVPTSHWAAEVRLRERALVSGLRERAPRSGVRRIRAVPGNAE